MIEIDVVAGRIDGVPLQRPLGVNDVALARHMEQV
jgi:hypothetical protein